MRFLVAGLLCACCTATAQTTATFSGPLAVPGIEASVAMDGVAHRVLTMSPESVAVGPVGVWMGTTHFVSVPDPIMFWGYNMMAEKQAHPRLYWGLEGNYFDASTGHTWAETYVEKWDSNGAHSRPLALGTHDGYADFGLYVSTFSFATCTWPTVGDPACAPLLNGYPGLLRVAPSSTLLMARGGTDSTRALDVAGPDGVTRGSIEADGSMRTPYLRLTGGGERPVCYPETVGTLWRTTGSTVDPKTADSVTICIWDGAAYTWKAIPLAGCP